MASSAMQTSWSALRRKDLRQHRRYALDAGTIKVSWLDITGSMKMTRTRGLNISEGGIAIELPEAALPLSLIRFQSDRFNVRGAGYVRHCRREGSRYVVGLEFAEGLHWNPPAGDPPEPIQLCDPEWDYGRTQ
jgi:hypothetical protein